jgi:type I restriction enzyme M protein
MNELRDQSKQLLGIAKTEVEKAIAQNKEVAINWIKKELQKLNICINQ